jgi:hypothetical protein
VKNVSCPLSPRDGRARRILTLGIIPIFLAGCALHFAYAWSGEWRPVALVAAVNESVWEHLKIAFWPAFLHGLLEWRLLRRRYPGFWLARGVGLLVTPLAIAGLFYAYTALLGRHLLTADIGTFLIGIAAGQWTCYRLLALRPGFTGRFAGSLLTGALLAAFACFTYLPPDLPLFRDASTGGLGIPD